MRWTISKFWPALEAVVGIAAVKVQWAWLLNEELSGALATQLLVCNGSVSRVYPREPGKSPSPLPYDVVEHANGQFVGVCPDGWDTVPLTHEQLLMWELDRQRLSDAVAAALNVSCCFEANVLPFTSRVGTYKTSAGLTVPVYLTIGLERAHLTSAAQRLAALHEPCILLAPTRELLAEECYSTLRARRLCFVALCEIFNAGESGGRFVATRTLTQLLIEQRCLSAENAITADVEAKQFVFRCQGNLRMLTFNNRSVAVQNTKGCSYIAYLLANPDLPLHASEVRTSISHRPELAALGKDKGTPALDRQSWADARQRVNELLDDVATARRRADFVAMAEAEKELAALAAQMRLAQGIGGRDRRVGSAQEQARKAVCMAIERALERIQKQHEPLWRHLDQYVIRGTFLKYAPPDPPPPWQL
jgi:hypothetical protein